jgi:hypothetical protein
MPTIFRKTAQGVTEIETRRYRLAPRMRSMLILVDGRRDSADLAQLITQQAEETLETLSSQGFIEAVGETLPAAALATTADDELGSASRPAPLAQSLLRNQPLNSAPTPAPRSEPPPDMNALRRSAIRDLTDQLGPSADSLAVRMERAKSISELQPLLSQAAQLIRAARGHEAAGRFSERFVAR